MPINSLDFVTSVTFWDGPAGLPADLDVQLFDDDHGRPVSPNNFAVDGVDSITNPLSGDTFVENFDDDFSNRKGFGFQIHAGNCFFFKLVNNGKHIQQLIGCITE